MRIDLFLKVSRLILRRTLAQEFCDAGRVKVNGAKAKSSKEVKAGDEIEIRRGRGTLTVRIVEVPNAKQVSKQLAPGLYEIISEAKAEEEF